MFKAIRKTRGFDIVEKFEIESENLSAFIKAEKDIIQKGRGYYFTEILTGNGKKVFKTLRYDNGMRYGVRVLCGVPKYSKNY